MAQETLKVKVVSSTPGGDSSTYNLFDSTVTFGAPNRITGVPTAFRSHCISRLMLRLTNSQAGTLKFYSSTDGGTTWAQTGGDISVSASTSTDINGPYDYLVDPYDDVKLDWVNGGVAQATWAPGVTLLREYHGPAT